MAADEDSPIYRDLMRFKPDELTPNAWALKAGVSRTVWADMRRHGNPSRRTLQKLLVAANSSLAEFEALRVEPGSRNDDEVTQTLADRRAPQWPPARLPSLPLLATSLAGEWGTQGSGVELTEVRLNEPVDRLARPQSLATDRDAYALTVVGDSMWPRFRPGRRIAISPRSAVAVGDDVAVRLRSRNSEDDVSPVLIKEFVRRTNDGFELRQFHPKLSFIVADHEVQAIHKIVGELI